MAQRFLSIWFPCLVTDWCCRQRSELRGHPFVLAAPDHGRLVVTAVNHLARAQGIDIGMAVADARAFIPGLQIIDEIPGQATRLLTAIGEWCIRFTPSVAVDGADGLCFDSTGCAHLWGGEEAYLKEILTRIRAFGYHASGAIADTVGAAWAVSRYSRQTPIVPPDGQSTALLMLPPAALRLEPAALEKLDKLGMEQISSFIHIQRPALRRRFGKDLLMRIDQALGREKEMITPLIVIAPYEERLPCLEPIVSRAGITIALERLLDTLCARLLKEGKGIRAAVLTCYRVDGKIQQVGIGTTHPSRSTAHLFKLFEEKIETIAPALGIKLFVLEATKVDDAAVAQETMWASVGSLQDINIAELLDRLADKFGAETIQRYVPSEHYWPERAYKQVDSLQEKPVTEWPEDLLRPVRLLSAPERIEVMAPIPDNPPRFFIYRGKEHVVKKADGPERIEQEWWIQDGVHRDYYCVEDDEGKRYWLYRAGHYGMKDPPSWFIHGFFA